MIKKKNILFLYFLLLIEVLILINSNLIINTVISSLKTYTLNILPSLLPTMIIGNLLVENNIELIIPKFINNIFYKLFNFNKIMTSIFIMSFFLGSPTNAIIINKYLENNLITTSEAETLLCCTHFLNPLFIVGTIGNIIFGNIKIGFIMLLILIISNLIKAFILKNNITTSNIINNKSCINNNNIINTLNSSIIASINACLLILGIIIMFTILIALINYILPINITINTIIHGLLEITGGIIKIKYLNINIYLKYILAYYFISFGGICIQMQTLSMFNNKKIRYLKYLIFRIF